MKKQILILPLAMMALLLVTSPQSASAHENHIYKIGDQFYRFTVGSLNEPITVDDTTGVDLHVNRSVGPQEDTKTETPIEGLDQNLKVELSAGDKKKTLDLRPTFRDPGKYTAKFYPTIQTTYIYRFFGTLNNVPVDLSFSCHPVGHPQIKDDKSEVKISDNITRTLKRGAFDCPTAKAGLGFPEPAIAQIDAHSYGITGIIMGLLGLIAGAGAFLRKRTN